MGISISKLNSSPRLRMKTFRFLAIFAISASGLPTITEEDANSFLTKKRFRREFDEGRMSCGVQISGRMMENVREEIEEVCEEPEEEAEGIFNIKGTLGRVFDGK